VKVPEAYAILTAQLYVVVGLLAEVVVIVVVVSANTGVAIMTDAILNPTKRARTKRLALIPVLIIRLPIRLVPNEY